MNNVDFVGRATSTGCGGFKVNLPLNITDWIYTVSPDIAYIDRASLVRMDGQTINLTDVKLSKGNKGTKYVLIPKTEVCKNNVTMGDMFKINLEWE